MAVLIPFKAKKFDGRDQVLVLSETCQQKCKSHSMRFRRDVNGRVCKWCGKTEKRKLR